MGIRELIMMMVKEEIKVFPGIPAKVVSVNLTPGFFTCTVEPLDDSADIQDVQLMAESTTGFLLVPKINSFVIIQEISNEAAYVSMFGELDSIQMLDGSLGGLVDVGELVSKLNVLEQRMTSHQHITTTNGVPTLVDVPSNPSITDTTVNDLENDKITHGI